MSGENEESEEQIAEDVRNLLKQNKKKITVEHVFKKEMPEGEGDSVPDGGFQKFTDGDDELEEVKTKLQHREAQLAMLALKAFEKEKEQLLELVPENKRERAEAYIGNDPDRLQELQFQYGGDDDPNDGAETPPPKGHARGLLRKPKTETTIQLGKFQNPELNSIAELYKIREKNPKNVDDMAMANVAEQKVEQLFEQIENGLKARDQGNKYNFQVAECTSCHTVLFGHDAETWASKGVCPKCGYKPKAGGH
jgi:hypothetical protein